MTEEEKKLLLIDLCARLPYGVIVRIRYKTGEPCYGELTPKDIQWFLDGKIENIKPYLRPMSSMTKEEKKELLCTIVGKDAVKYFQVLSDGSIDNTDAAHQDLRNFSVHWINFDGSNTTSYIDWLIAHYFDYRGLISMGLALEAPEGMYNLKDK